MTRTKKGRPKFKQANDLVKSGALGGAFWGALIGLLFLMPFAGMAIGAVIGALTGRMGDVGLSDEFMKEVSQSVGPDESALFLLVNSWNEERVLEELNEFNPELIQTNLSAEDEKRLKEAFGAEAIEEWRSNREHARTHYYVATLKQVLVAVDEMSVLTRCVLLVHGLAVDIRLREG